MSIIARSEVAFGQPLSSEQVHGLLAHIQDQMVFRSVAYTITINRQIPAHKDVEPLPGEHSHHASFELGGTFYPSPLQMARGPAV